MKFRAVIRESSSMRDFLNIATTLSKCGKDLIFNIRQDVLVIAVNIESPHAALPMWCDMEKSFFEEYTMEGLSETHTEIILTMKSANLVRALATGRATLPTFVKLKLVNKNMACLCVEMEIPSSVTEKNRVVTNDVPVTVVSRRDWGHYKLPEMPEFWMVLSMPPAKDVKPVIETLKNTAPVICIQTTNEGRKGTVSFIAESGIWKISCHCREQSITCDPNLEEDENVMSCEIDTKKLALFLTSSQFPNSPMRCSISPDHLVKFEVEIQGKVTMICIIAATNE
ncbi:checkpoint protein HUS1 [Lutzomyia longipalpis]|uniref:checkpoint protein HUS1 n=1 Tax=Lutzomyia longipalpis TaxID=7200 RepID=UPI002484003F|nr:checkpoint protein HUS1 [Lutzomyia longipalpis]